MKKLYILLLVLFFHSYFCLSQQPNDNDDQRVEVIKMAYITHELNLSPQEAQNFWPVYNSYQNEIKQARSQYQNDEVAYERKVVEIKQRYQGNFKKVLGNNGQRLNKVYTTDRNFREMLRAEQHSRQEQKQQQNPPPKKLQKQNNNGNENGKKIRPNNPNVRKPNNGNAKKPHSQK